MAREKKFNFIPERQINKQADLNSAPEHFITVSPKYKNLRFSTALVKDHKLDKRHIKLYADPAKKTIAYRIVKEDNGLDKLKEWRKVSYNKTSGNAVMSITKVLKALNVKPEDKNQKLSVKEYNDQMLGDTYYYIKMK